MPTKKGSSKASKSKKASGQQRKAPKRGVAGRPGATRRVATGRATATGAGRGTSKKSPAGPRVAKAPAPFIPRPEDLPQRKVTDTGAPEQSGRLIL